MRVQCPARWHAYTQLASPEFRLQALLKDGFWLTDQAAQPAAAPVPAAQGAASAASTLPPHTLAAQVRLARAASSAVGSARSRRTPAAHTMATRSTTLGGQAQPPPPPTPAAAPATFTLETTRSAQVQTRAAAAGQARLQRAVHRAAPAHPMATRSTPPAAAQAQAAPPPPAPLAAPPPAVPARSTRRHGARSPPSTTPPGVTHTTATRRTARSAARVASGLTMPTAPLGSLIRRQRSNPELPPGQPRPTTTGPLAGAPPLPQHPPLPLSSLPAMQAPNPPPGPVQAVQAPNPPPRPQNPPIPIGAPPSGDDGDAAALRSVAVYFIQVWSERGRMTAARRETDGGNPMV